MTLQEARVILYKYREAIDTVIRLLPDDDGRESVEERLGQIRAMIVAATGRDPLIKRSRVRTDALMRQAVALQLRNEGYTYHAIGDAMGYNHSTIVHAQRMMEEGLKVGDYETKKVWRQLMDILNHDSPPERDESAIL